MDEWKGAGIAGLFFTLLFGALTVWGFGWMIGTITALFSGLIFGLLAYFFTTSKAIRAQTSIDCEGEEILHSGVANHFLGAEGVGGRLYILSSRLVFQSHRYNAQPHRWECPFREIQEIRPFQSLGLLPIGIEVVAVNGTIDRFTVNGRRRWLNKLRLQLNAD